VLKQLKVIFLGSGPIAVPILEALYNSELIQLAGVVTQPDRPAGRKRVLTPTPLGQAALALGLEPMRVENVNTPEFLDKLAALEPDMLCVVSFGQILKTPLLALPKRGCVNVHASILPKYRGASPITQCLLNGDAETGVGGSDVDCALEVRVVERMGRRRRRGLFRPSAAGGSGAVRRGDAGEAEDVDHGADICLRGRRRGVGRFALNAGHCERACKRWWQMI
jgi:hypothetical protein